MITFTGNEHGSQTSCKKDLEGLLLRRSGSLYSFLTCNNKPTEDAMGLDPVQHMGMDPFHDFHSELVDVL